MSLQKNRSTIAAQYIVLMTLIVLLAACAVGPDFHRPDAPAAKAYQPEPLPGKTTTVDIAQGDAQQFVEGQNISAQWWTLFHSPALNELIEQSLTASPNVVAAQAALRNAWENVYAQQGAFSPSLGASFTPTRQKTAGALSAVPSSGAYIYNLHTAQLNVSYAPDIFGGNRRQVESLVAQADMQRFQLEATYLTLTTNLVNAAIQDAALRAQIIATQAIIDDQARTLESYRRQFVLGQVAEADVATQQAALAQMQATLPPLQKQLAQQRDLILALGGRLPDEKQAPTFELAGLQLPQELPLSLPSKLVEQRPDILAAEAQLHAASALVGVAIANRLPNISIDASLGSSSDHFSKLFATGNAFWNLAGSIVQPIFDGGTLQHRQRAAEAAYIQADAEYRGTVITAFQNVADTLHAIQSDADALRAVLAAERAAWRALEIAQHRLALGDISALMLLNAQQTWRQAQLGLIQAQANRLTDSVALFQALGGCWWNRADGDTADLKRVGTVSATSTTN